MLSFQHQPTCQAALSGKASAVAQEARLIVYSSGNFGKNLVFGGADATVLFLLTDLFYVSATMAGFLMLVALAGDLIFDLLAAILVIALRRRGRGYRWLIVAGAIPGGIAFALLYAVPAMGGEEGWVLAAVLLAFRGAYAVIDVPHNALMTQISTDSRSRGRVSGYRLFFSTSASLAVAAILAPAVQDAAARRVFGTLAQIGLTAGALFALTLIASALTSKGSARKDDAAGDGLAVPVRDRQVLAVALIGVVTGFAAPAFTRMLLYVGGYVIGRPAEVSSMLIAVTGGQFLGVFLWTALTGRYDKSVLLAAGHAVSTLGIALFGLAIIWPPALPACCVLIGVGLTSVFMLPWGILADLVDFVAWRHGRRFETGLFAAYLVVVKASGAASTAMIGWALGWLGYIPGAAQTETVRSGMVALGLGLPIAGSVCAILVLRRLDMGHARHATLVRALDRRRTRVAGLRTVNPAPIPSRD
jgi:GPH family glycoside/pentoside/hexuronide:cation symporter